MAEHQPDAIMAALAAAFRFNPKLAHYFAKGTGEVMQAHPAHRLTSRQVDVMDPDLGGPVE